MQRIAIIGQPGSGKSTLARALGARTGLPVYHMDHIHWKPGWKERDRDERVAMALDVLAQDAWILDGNMSKINEARLHRAQVLIWLDFPFALRAWRVAVRTLRYFGRTRPDLQKDCREGLNPEMLRFWRYIWTTRHTGREKIAASLRETPQSLQVYRLTSRADVALFLHSDAYKKSRALGPAFDPVE